MAINLEKGQREKINIPSFKVGLGWVEVRFGISLFPFLFPFNFFLNFF